MKKQAGFKVLKGNLFDSAIMKTSVISDEFRKRYPVQPEGQERVRGPRRGVRRAGGLSPPHRRSVAEDRRAHASCSCAAPAPIGYPGSAEVVNMQPPARADQKGHHVAALHRRRTAVRHLGLAVDPQRLAGSGGRRRAGAAQDRRPRAHRSQQGHGGYPDLEGRAGEAPRRRWRKPAATNIRRSQTPWQEIQRGMVDQLADGMVLKPAVKYQRVAQTSVPRDNH